MSELPTFISTAQAPRSTGVGSPIYVENVDPMGKAIGKGGEVVTDIQQQMVKTQNAQAVNHAKLGATIKLNNLTTRLAKENPTTVGQIAEAEIQKIYNEETSGLSETARQAFDAIFTPLHGQARANIQAQAVKTHNDEQVAGLVRLLAGLKKTHDPIKTPISTKTNFGIGAKAITDAVNGRNITAEEGAKLLIKFRNELSEQGVKRWINSQTSDTLMKAYHQMDQGKIKNLAIRRLWDQLDDDKKGKLRQDAVTEWSRLGAQVDKAEARKVKQAQKSARRDIFTVLDTATSEKDRNAAMERLRDNPEGLSPNQFRQLLDDVAGRTDQFNDDDVVNGISTRILEGDPNLTEKEIATAGGVNFATKKRLIKELREAEK
jgi:CRISPR/Cas system CSM-associated protein Csm2 small subunit